MEDQAELMLRQGLSFYGKIAASLSHELNNAMAIINEHNGLLDDMIKSTTQGLPIDEKKLQRASTKISVQLARTKELIARLNKFAHGSDREVTELDLVEVVEAITALTQRLAGLKGKQLDLLKPGQPVMIRSNAFFIQQAVFGCLEIFINEAGEGRQVEISMAMTGDAAAIRIAGRAGIGDELMTAREAELGMLIQKLNGTVKVEDEVDGKRTIILSLRNLT